MKTKANTTFNGYNRFHIGLLSKSFIRSFFLKFLACIFICNSNLVWAENSGINRYFQNYAIQKNIQIETGYKENLAKGFKYFRQGNYLQAAHAFGSAALKSPNHPLPNFYLACSLFGLDEYEMGGKVLERTISLYDNWKNFPIDLLTIFSRKQFEAQIHKFELWLFKKRRELESYFFFGFLCQFSGKTRKAELAYRVVLKVNPHHRETQLFFEMLVGKKIKARLPDYEHLKEKAQKFLWERKYKKALEIWLTACIQHSQKKEVLYYLSYTFAANGYFQQSALCLRLSIQKFPESIETQMRNQKDLLKKDLWLSSLEDYAQSQKEQKDSLLLLCWFYAVIGEIKKSKIAWKYLEKMQPKNPEVKILGKFLKNLSIK